ncbi:hypothetical protein NEOLEDRAFT_1177825 [Neolentinus lepideus HHB14362 ss-1]|uniref:Uncharacterized protein n=1 Tax=Neolentinus lepideus HHB14362 ss-1 TaxID=1314782 RepID=A0A165T1M8_9AGAM|nr:hypothetical protein NEOLEDRAFT_1177825 [Neolentinus lepideus HHB14362 ss-1]
MGMHPLNASNGMPLARAFPSMCIATQSDLWVGGVALVSICYTGVVTNGNPRGYSPWEFLTADDLTEAASIQVTEAIVADFDVEAAISQAEEAALAREVDEGKISDDEDDLPLQYESPLSYFDTTPRPPRLFMHEKKHKVDSVTQSMQQLGLCIVTAPGSTKAPEVVTALADVDTLWHGNSGYQVGNICVGPQEKHEYTFEDPDIQKMCYIRWDGHTMTPIANGDHNDAIVLMVLVGHPMQGWDAVVKGASVALEEARVCYRCPTGKHTQHSGGCKAPGNISISGGQDNAVKAYP